MKNCKVKATRNFFDKIENVDRNINDVFECTDERCKYLIEKNAVTLIKISDEDVVIVDEKEKFTEEEIANFKNEEVAEVVTEKVEIKKSKKKNK